MGTDVRMTTELLQDSPKSLHFGWQVTLHKVLFKCHLYGDAPDILQKELISPFLISYNTTYMSHMMISYFSHYVHIFYM